MRLRGLAVVVLLATLARADVETLVHRAEVRAQHSNLEGAERLLRAALEEDPCCGPALWQLANVDYEDSPGLLLRHLEVGRPLDPSHVRDALLTVGRHLADLPEEVYLAAERATLLPTDGGDEACGPWRPWERPLRFAPPELPAGPLRGEAFGTAAYRRREVLRRIAARLDREGTEDAIAWALLAMLHHRVGDGGAAKEALGHAKPSTLDQRLSVAAARLGVCDDPAGWWRANGAALLSEAVARGRRVPRDGRPDEAVELCSAARDVLSEARDLQGLVALAAAQSQCMAVGASNEVLEETVSAIGRRWFLEDACDALKKEGDPIAACVRAEMLFEMKQTDQAVAVLERVVHSHPDCIEAWARLASFHAGAGGAVAEDIALWHLLGKGPLDDRGPCNPIERTIFLDRCLRDDRAAALTSRRLLRECPGQSTVDCVLHAWRGATVPADVASDLLRAVRESGCIWGVDDALEMAVQRGLGREVREWVAQMTPPSAEMGICRRAWLKPVEIDLDARERLLRAFATGASLTLSEDSFLRASLRPPAGSDIAFGWVRARQELEADASFADSPGGAYVLSLLWDPVFGAEEAKALRRRAFDRGFRSPFLLLDLVRDGVDVSAGLAEVEPVVARLVHAVASQRTEALEAFLEDDEAWPVLLKEARTLLPFHPSAPKEVPVEERLLQDARFVPASVSQGEVARDVWNAFVELPDRLEEVVRATQVNLPAVNRACGAVPFAEGHTAVNRLILYLDVRLLGHDGAARLAHLSGPFPVVGKECEELLDEAAALADPAEMQRFLDDPATIAELHPGFSFGISWDDSVLFTQVLAQAKRHPRDLRWLELAKAIAPKGAREEVRKEVQERLLETSRRDPLSIDYAAGGDSTTLVRLALDVVDDDPPRAILARGYADIASRFDKDDLRRAVRWFEGRCRDEADVAAVSGVAEEWGIHDLTAKMDRALISSADRERRAEALLRTWKRGGGQVAAERDIAREAGWTPSQARRLWLQVIADAERQGDGGVATEALEALWFRFPSEGAPQSLMDTKLIGRLVERGKAHFIAPFDAVLAAHADLTFGSADWKKEGDLAERLIAVGVEPWANASRLGTDALWRRAARLTEGMERLPADMEHGDFFGIFVREWKGDIRPETLAAAVDAWARRAAVDADADDALARLLGHKHVRFSPLCDCPLCLCRVHARDVDPDVISAATLRELHVKGALERVAAAESRCSDPALRELIAFARAGLEDVPTGIHTLKGLLRDGANEYLRWMAYDRLCDLYPRHVGDFVEAMLEDVPQADTSSASLWERRLSAEVTRTEADAELRGEGERALPALKALRESSNPEVRALVEGVLADLARP